MQRLSCNSPGWLAALLSVIIWANFRSVSCTQDEVKKEVPLIQREPFDILTLLDKDGVPVELVVFPINLPNRRVPANPSENMTINVRLQSRPYELYKVAWKDINAEGCGIKLYENMMLAEAKRLMSGKDTLPQAYEYFAVLFRDYAFTEGLQEARQDYLFLDGFSAQLASDHEEAYAAFEELYRVNKGYRHASGTGVVDMIGQTLEPLCNDHFQTRNFEGLRQFLAHIQATYGGEQKAVVDRWFDNLRTLAESKMALARKLLDESQGRAAYEAVAQMMNVLPTVDGGRALQREIVQRYPLAFVAVTQPALDDDPRRLDNWASRRVGRLTRRMLVEFAGIGPEGGLYKCPLGSVLLSDDGRELTFSLNVTVGDGEIPPMNAYQVADRLLGLADPNSKGHLPAWARLVSRVRVDDPKTVVVELSHLHVLPESFLQIFLSLKDADSGGEEAGGQDGPYLIKARDDEKGEVVFAANPKYNLQSTIRRPEIVEIHYNDSQAAIDALRRGDIHVIDQVFPADVARLRKDPSIVVEPYDLPTLHVLIPNTDDPFMDNLTFRRSIAYGIHRDLILKQLLLAGVADEECRLVSGPFPGRTPTNDAVAYAYNPLIVDRLPERRLASTLAILGEKQIGAMAEKLEKTPPMRSTFTLAHPASELARIACTAIKLHLQLNGIELELIQLPPGQTNDPQREYDLLYAEIAMWEPLVDARRLIESSGLTSPPGPYTELALRQLDAATNWTSARKRLHDLHDAVYNDLSVIPLWQMANYFAYRKTLQGVGSRPLTLYQNIQQWQIIPE